MQVRDFSFLHKGINPVSTTSSLLVSSSKYLNNPIVRQWITDHFLRRNGPDQPVPPDTTLGLYQELFRIRDIPHIAAMIEREKTINAPFKAWVDERRLFKLTKHDFGKFPRGSFGWRYYEYLVDRGFELNLGRGEDMPEPSSDLEFIQMRFSQTHDLEHLVTGGDFNSLGEVIPYFARLANTHQHMSPELANVFTEVYVFGGFRLVMRSALHYPTTWLTMIDLLRRSFNIGLGSKSILMAPYEDVFHLPLPEAREALGIRFAEDIDTAVDDEVFIEDRQPTEAELGQVGRPDLARAVEAFHRALLAPAAE